MDDNKRAEQKLNEDYIMTRKGFRKVWPFKIIALNVQLSESIQGRTIWVTLAKVL